MTTSSGWQTDMPTYKFYLIAAMIYIAPHISRDTAMITGLVAIVLAVIFFFIDEAINHD